MTSAVQSWTRTPRVRHAGVLAPTTRFDRLPQWPVAHGGIPHGNGRSYSDVALNPDGAVLRTRSLDHFIAFDVEAGILACEGGVLLSDILALIVPQGWFLPVVPGTRFVTVGGAIANDVHGKNHHVAGTFGHHIRAFELLRSDGTRLRCSPTENPEWFAATIGGLGLTGLIVSAQIALVRIANPFMLTQASRFESLDAFWPANARAEKSPYAVAWIDCMSRSGRGVMHAGAHAPPQSDLPPWRERRRSVPTELPLSLVNGLSLRLFNALYYRRPIARAPQLTHYVPYFFPLDAVQNWNRIYGRKGFFQYQCVIPPAGSANAIREMTRLIARSGKGSFLAVLKTFGRKPPLGLLSFAREGTTFALDFPNGGEDTARLFASLDAVVSDAGGALYPAKDSRMPAAMFRSGFPRWEEFSSFVDPQFMSGFWRRVGAKP